MRTGVKLTTLAAAIALAMGSGAVFAATPTAPAATQLPGQGKVIVGGAAGSIAGSTLTVTLPANSVINWGGSSATTAINPTGTAGFNIGSNATVTFSGASGVLNVDVSGNPSQIFGTLNAGDATAVYVANSNGIIVGSGATINGTGATVGLIGNTLINADGTTFTGAAYPAGGPSYMGTGGDVTVQPSATIEGATVLISGGGNVNVDLGSLASGNASLQAGVPNSTNALVTANSGASLTIAGTSGGATVAQFAAAGDATINDGTLDTSGLTYGAYTVGTPAFADSDVAGTFTNNGAVTATGNGLTLSGDVVNNGKIDATGQTIAVGGITNLGTLLSADITSGAFINQGNVTSAAGVSVTGGDLNNAGSLSTGAVTVTDGSIVNSGKLTVAGGSIDTLSDGLATNGFTAGANYSITNTGTITSTSAGGLILFANIAQTGGPAPHPDNNGSTGGIHSTGALQLGAGGALTAFAFNNVQLLGAVQVQGAKPGTFVNTSAASPLAGLSVAGGDIANAGRFAATGGVTIAPSIFSTGIINASGNTVALMGNIGGANALGVPLATSLNIIAGATPDTGYAVRVAAGMTASAGTIRIDGDTAGDTPNVILQGTLNGNTVTLGSPSIGVGDVLSGPAGGIYVANTLNINSTGRVKTAPYLNDANFRYNYLPVTNINSTGAAITVNIDADSMQGTPTSGYNLLVHGDVNLATTWSGTPSINGTGTAVTGVNVVPNSHFVLQSTGDIATTGALYWPGYIYLGNIGSDADGNAMPGTLGAGTITLGGNFSNVLPGDVNGASGIHFITQFPLSMGAFAVTTNANAWVNFGSDALTQLYSGQNGATGPFFGGTQGPGKVVNYGPLAPANFVTQAPVSAQ